MKFALAAIIIAMLNGACVESFDLVEMISDYAKISKNAEKQTTETVANLSVTTTEYLPENETETTTIQMDYEDFDDLQEEDRAFNQPSSSETMMKYFNGIVSLLALMYKFNGRPSSLKPQKLHFKSQNEPRDSPSKRESESGKRFQEAQDRFEFPQKKFKYQEGGSANMIDQQMNSMENYPPYYSLTSNNAESYSQNGQKTSYDSDLAQYDGNKNSAGDYNQNDVEIQQSYSYEIPYESPKPVNDDAMSWSNQNIHPVYKPWMSKPQNDAKPDMVDSYQPQWVSNTPDENSKNSYQPWISKPMDDKPTYQPWKSKIPDEPKPTKGDSEARQPWKNKFPSDDFPIFHHHDFKDPQPDHHFEYHEIDHPAEEDRVSKKPYSYYFLGRKLWYVPLLFSVYFIIYIGALVLKSVARHKIQFPDKLWALHEDQYGHVKHRRHRKIDYVTEKYENALEKIKNKYM